MLKPMLALLAVGIVPVLLGCASTVATQPESGQVASPSVRFWLHPKLGMVRIDPRTGAMLTAPRAN